MTAGAKPGQREGGGALDCCARDLVLMEGENKDDKWITVTCFDGFEPSRFYWVTTYGVHPFDGLFG